MRLAPITLKAAKSFVDTHHRHNGSPRGWKFGVGLHDDNDLLIGVGIAGRPVSRMLDDGTTLEITRICVLDGHRNANSMLYGALIRAGKALGYVRFITYTLASESGVSLKAAGFRQDGSAGGGEWTRPSRPRASSQKVGYDPQLKTRWVLRTPS